MLAVAAESRRMDRVSMARFHAAAREKQSVCRLDGSFSKAL